MERIELNEVWLPIVGFEGFYEVSNLGNVRSLDRFINHRSISKKAFRLGKTLKKKYNRGYVFYCLCINDKKAYKRACRLVALHFIPNPENCREVDHIDRNRANDSVDNLRWVTAHLNQQNRKRTKLNPYPFISWSNTYNTWKLYFNMKGIKSYKTSRNLEELRLKLISLLEQVSRHDIIEFNNLHTAFLE